MSDPRWAVVPGAGVPEARKAWCRGQVGGKKGRVVGLNQNGTACDYNLE